MRKLLVFVVVVVAALVSRASSAQSVLPRSGWVANASSSNGGDVPSHVLDGSSSTRWTTGGNQTPGEWLSIDMQTAQTFTQVTMDVAGNTSDYARSYELYVSNDGQTWGAPVASGIGATGIITVVFPQKTARFIGIVQTGTSSANWWSVAELNVYSGTVPTVPLTPSGWTVTASVHGSSDVAANAIDGNVSTRFSTDVNQASGQSFQLDMGSAQLITALKMDSGTNTSDYARGYQIYASNSTSNWGAAIASGAATSSPILVYFAQTTARYVKIVQTGTATNWWSIAELTVYTVGSSAPTASVLPRLGWSASASVSGSGSGPTNALDDNGSTRWSTGVNQASGQSFVVDMQTSWSFTQVTLDSGSGSASDYPRGYQVYVSNDGSSWGTAIATGAGSSEVTTISFAPQSARYIKVVQTATSSTNWWSIAELNVYGVPPATLLRAGWMASAVLDSGDAQLGIDGRSETQWSTETAQVSGQTYQVDMKVAQSFNEIMLDVNCNPADYPRGYQVFASNSTSNWGSAIASGTGTSSMIVVAFAPQSARYLKVVQTASASNYWGLAELNVVNTNPSMCAAPCVALDACHVAGTCNPSTGVCSNPTAANGTACSDGNACTQIDTCQAGACTGSNPVTCAASDQCHAVGTCNTSSGVCSNPVATNGTSCSDGNACTQADTCQSGVCTGGSAVACTASDQCHTAGTCNPASGICSNPTKTNGTSCSDGNACTQTDTCQAGTCTGSNLVTCAASDQCHGVGVCDPSSGICSTPAVANGTSCNDGNACTQTDTCLAGVCTGASPVSCVASDQCHAPGTCNPSTGACTNPVAANGTACSDGNACTQTDTCQTGVCTGSNPVTCAASDQCHTAGTCSSSTGACSNPTKANGTTCSDGNACTQTDTCQSGTCMGGSSVTCTASDQCHTAGTCDPSSGACSNPAKANGTSCSDGNACTQTDTCVAGTCTGGSPITCAASDQCHAVGTCNTTTGVCSNPTKTDGTSCSDGNACTQTDTCVAGTCTGGSPVTCAASDQCHAAGSCDPASGACSNPAKSDGTSCSDGNACTQTDTCVAGTCTGGNSVTCAASDQCHTAGTCNTSTGTCSNPAKTDGTSCSDNNACTQTDTCVAGTCTGANPVTCAASDQCHAAGACDPTSGVCSNPAKANGSACDDGNACTSGDVCAAGACMSGTSSCNENAVVTSTNTNAQVSPTLHVVPSANPLKAAPGQVVTYSGQVTNTVYYSAYQEVDVTNNSTSTFVIPGYTATLEYLSATTHAWVAVAGVAFDVSGHSVPTTAPATLPFSANQVVIYNGGFSTADTPGVTYSSNYLAGTSISVGSMARVAVFVNYLLPGQTAQLLFDPAQATAVRLALHIDSTPGLDSGADTTLDLSPLPMASDLALTDVSASLFVNNASPGATMTAASSDPLPLGATRLYSATALAPTISPPNPTVNAVAYLGYLNQQTQVTTTFAVEAEGTSGGQQPSDYEYGTPVGVAIPILSATKAGPSTGTVGDLLAYSVALENSGTGTATNLSISDSVVGAAGFAVTPPTSIDPGDSATAPFQYQSDPGATAGPLSDVVTVTWQDANDNVYGPITSGLTTTLTPFDHPPVITSTPVTDFPRGPETGPAQPFDVRTWTDTQYQFFSQPPANWIIDPSGTSATQSVNADASALVGPMNLENVHVGGTWVVNAGDDNDFIGFVFGWQDRTHYYLFDWRDDDETGGGGVGLQGMTVKLVDADSDLDATDLWPTSGNGTRVRPLYHNDIRWSHFQPYDFTLDYQPGHFTIQVTQGTTVLDTISIDDSTYKSGQFGFYNDSQDGVVYSGFSYQSLAGSLYRYDVSATDPDGDPITFSLVSAPPGMSIDPNTGILAWDTTVGSGAYEVTIAATDPAGKSGYQTYTVTVQQNAAPVVDAGPDQQVFGASFPTTIPLAGSVNDELPLTDPRVSIAWSEVSGPGPVTFADATSPTTTALFVQPGTYVLELTASDSVATGTDLVTIFVDSQPSLAGATIGLVASSVGPLTDGTPLTLTATVKDSGGTAMSNVAVQFGVVGANGQAAYAATNALGLATYTYTGTNTGTDVIQAVAMGGGGAPTATLPGIVWTASGPSVLTQGWIGAPLQQATLTGQVPVTIAAGTTLTSGTLTYWPASAPDQLTTLATNVAGGPGATIGTFDTTVLSNGPWVLKLDATNSDGTEHVSEIEVTASGDYKPGREVVQVTDMTIPVTGIPITVGRRYDSLEKDSVGDFGHGWSLTLGHPDLVVDPANNVTITMPDGRRVTFYFQATSATASIAFAWLYAPGYVPEAGTYGTLTSDGCDLIVPSGGQLVCFLDGNLNYAPTTYTYTDQYGRKLVMGSDSSLKSITDLQGNALTFTPAGISSSTGVSVAFARDAQGRITSVTSPAVDATHGPLVYGYEYDAHGDLVKVDLPSSANNQYTYSTDHRLLTTKDANGNPARTSTFDTAGRLSADTDALGNVTRYAYDVAGRKTTTTNPDLGVEVQTFDANGLLLKETDPLSRTTQHTYDANRNELTRTNAAGEVTTMTYDANGNQTSIKNGRAEKTTTTYNGSSQPVTSTDPSGHTTTIAYDDSGIPMQFSDEIGTLATFTSSDHGLPLTVTDAEGKTAYLTYDGAGNLTSRTDRLGRVTSTTYDGTGRKTSSTDARSGAATYSYDAMNNLVAQLDPLSNNFTWTRDANENVNDEVKSDSRPQDRRETSHTYDANNRVTKDTYLDGTTRQYTRDFRGNKLTETDESGRVTTYAYDKAGQLTRTMYADGTVTTGAYDDLGRLSTATDERGNATTYVYETGCGCADRLTTVIDPLGRATVTTYDSVGRRSSVTDAAGHTTSYSYDSRGHLTETDYADGTKETDVYDTIGRRTAHTDQMDSVTRYGYDAEGQLTSVTDALTNVTQYFYDLSGNLASTTDANGHVTSYTYDLLNRKASRTLPLGQAESFSYDIVGNQVTHVDFRGKTSTYSFDIRDRALTKVPDPSLGEPTVTFRYNPTGTRTSMVDASGTTTYGYDVRDRLLSKATPAGTLTYTYDLTGNVATIRSSNANGTSVDYTWDPANQLVSVKDNQAGGVTTAAYTATGRPSTLGQPTGVGARYSYDTNDRVTSLSWQRGANPAFGIWSYGFNGRGQRTSATDATGRHVAYGYDAVSRLVEEAITSDPQGVVGNGDLSYSLDPIGNRLTRTSTLAALGAQMFTYDANDQLDSAGYDANGNMTSADGHTYTYDFENRLRSKDGSAVTIVYDGDGNRVAKTASSVTTQYLVDDLNPTGYLQVLEEAAGGAVQTTYTYGTVLVSQTRQPSGRTSYYGYDAQGNVAFLTDTTGIVVNSYDYDAWGNITSSNEQVQNTRLYGAQELDPDLGLINLRARYYETGAGRFLTIDPAMGDPFEPRSFNRYLYGAADPRNLGDPSGRDVAFGYASVLQAATVVVTAVAAWYATRLLAQKYVEYVGVPDRRAPVNARNIGGCEPLYQFRIAVCLTRDALRRVGCLTKATLEYVACRLGSFGNSNPGGGF